MNGLCRLFHRDDPRTSSHIHFRAHDPVKILLSKLNALDRFITRATEGA
jgi:hypothetical protein